MYDCKAPESAKCGFVKHGFRQCRVLQASMSLIIASGTCLSAASPPQSGPDDSGFPEQYVSHEAPSGIDRIWKRVYSYMDVYRNNPDPGLALLQPNDGIALAYTSAGPAMKPGSELTPMQLLRAVVQQKPVPTGQPGYLGSYYALLHKKNNTLTLLPTNFDPSHPDQIYTAYPIYHQKSLYDAAVGKYFIFSANAPFKAADYDKSLISWTHFDAWWLDTNNETIEHVVLPPGPWVDDAGLDDVLLRGPRNFACGVDCYRQYDIKVSGGNIVVTITGRPSAISRSATGTYALHAGTSKWEKVSD